MITSKGPFKVSVAFTSHDEHSETYAYARHTNSPPEA